MRSSTPTLRIAKVGATEVIGTLFARLWFEMDLIKSPADALRLIRENMFSAVISWYLGGDFPSECESKGINRHHPRLLLAFRDDE